MTDRLILAAQEVRKNAYSPYSHYQVGAAVLGRDGKVYVGCNVENASYGGTICAERMAVGAMVAAGCTSIAEIAIATKDGGTPCGLCRQVLVEFANGPVSVHCVGENGSIKSFALEDLLPEAFKL